MSSSIYDISDWSTGTVFTLHDITKNNNLFYYATEAHTAGASFDSSKFGGITTFNGVTRPQFIWEPNYNISNEFEPATQQIKFGDGYEQRIPRGINNNLIALNLQFNGRDTDEGTAITHFIFARSSKEAFVWTPPPPISKQKLFVCRKWTSDFNFFENYNIAAIFEEVVA